MSRNSVLFEENAAVIDPTIKGYGSVYAMYVVEGSSFIFISASRKLGRDATHSV